MTSPPNSSSYEFREEDLFQRDRARLAAEGISDDEFDNHLFSIQDSIRPDPFREPWSRPLNPDNPSGNRIAVSDATEAEPNALKVIFRVEGDLIRLWRVRRRDE